MGGGGEQRHAVIAVWRKHELHEMLTVMLIMRVEIVGPEEINYVSCILWNNFSHIFVARGFL